jgi:hypothetical protein
LHSQSWRERTLALFTNIPKRVPFSTFEALYLANTLASFSYCWEAAKASTYSHLDANFSVNRLITVALILLALVLANSALPQ